MISGPSEDETVGTGADGASLGVSGVSVGDGSTFVIVYEALEETAWLGVGAEDDLIVLNEGVGVGSVMDVESGVDSAMLDTGDVAFADDEGAIEDATACDEDAGAIDTTGVSAGTDDGEGGTVVYCVTMTTGGTCNDVDGRSSAEGDAMTEEKAEEDVGAAGTVADAELESDPGAAGMLVSAIEEGGELAEEGTSDAARVGKTVVYSVFVTTRRDDVIIVVFPGARSAELTGSAEGDACMTDVTFDELVETAPVELTKALLRAAVA